MDKKPRGHGEEHGSAGYIPPKPKEILERYIWINRIWKPTKAGE